MAARRARVTEVAAIVLHPVDEPGHIRPMLALARQLTQRGHDVSFVGWGNTADYVRNGGGVYRELFDDLVQGIPNELHRLVLATPYADGAIARRMSALDVDLILVDASLAESTLAAREAGLAEALISPLLPQGYRRLVPPLSSPQMKAGSLTKLIASNSAWAHLVARQWGALYLRRLQALGKPPSNAAMHTYLLEMRRRTHTSRRELRYTAEFAEFVVASSSKIVLCPPEFDFAPAPTSWTYVEPCIDWTGQVPLTGPFEALDDRPLVVCALGTQTSRYQSAEAVIRSLVEALGRRPHLQGVVASGSTVIEPHDVPSNVLVQPQIPQLALLSRAALFITHGGINSIKESIVSGVPMLVVPKLFDQPGNSARVVYHGLGDRLLGDRVNADTIGARVDRLVDDRITKQRLARWRVRWRRLMSEHPAAEAVESLLGPGRG